MNKAQRFEIPQYVEQPVIVNNKPLKHGASLPAPGGFPVYAA